MRKKTKCTGRVALSQSTKKTADKSKKLQYTPIPGELNDHRSTQIQSAGNSKNYQKYLSQLSNSTNNLTYLGVQLNEQVRSAIQAVENEQKFPNNSTPAPNSSKKIAHFGSIQQTDQVNVSIQSARQNTQNNFLQITKDFNHLRDVQPNNQSSAPIQVTGNGQNCQSNLLHSTKRFAHLREVQQNNISSAEIKITRNGQLSQNNFQESTNSFADLEKVRINASTQATGNEQNFKNNLILKLVSQLLSSTNNNTHLGGLPLNPEGGIPSFLETLNVQNSQNNLPQYVHSTKDFTHFRGVGLTDQVSALDQATGTEQNSQNFSQFFNSNNFASNGSIQTNRTKIPIQANGCGQNSQMHSSQLRQSSIDLTQIEGQQINDQASVPISAIRKRQDFENSFPPFNSNDELTFLGSVKLNDLSSESINRRSSQNNIANILNQQTKTDPSEEEVPPNISDHTERIIVPTVDEGVQCTLIGVDLNSEDRQHMSKIYSHDMKQYIAKKLKNNSLLYSAKLLFTIEKSKIFVKIHGLENLLTDDKGDFLAKVQILPGPELDFSKKFSVVKSNLYDRYIIVKIFQDLLLDNRNKAYNNMKKMLTERKNKLVGDREFVEDILQLTHIIHQSRLATNSYLLQQIKINQYISIALKREAEHLLIAEENLITRNKALPKFSVNVSVVVNDLYKILKDVSEEGITKHKSNLEQKFPTNNYHLLRQLLTISSLPTKNLLYISSSDIALFSDLHTIYKQLYPEGEGIIQAFIDNLWHSFFSNLKNVKEYEAIQNVKVSINPVYVFLFKSFLELQFELCAITKATVKDLFYNDGKKFKVTDRINFPEYLPINRALEHQHLLIFKLLKFYHPKEYFDREKFTYDFNLKERVERCQIWSSNNGSINLESISQERLVWLYILDLGLSHISTEPSNKLILIFRSLFLGFTKFIRESEYDRFESFRVVTHNTIRLAANICPYVSNIRKESEGLDEKILDGQINIIKDMFSSEDTLVMDHFPNLIKVYNEYWKSRDSIVGKIIHKCPYVEFRDEIKNSIFLQLLKVVEIAISKKVTLQTMSNFFRLYREFLEHFKSLKFEWLVSVSSIQNLKDKTFSYCQIVNKEAGSLMVSNSGKFIEDLKSKDISVPKHYFIELIKQLLETVRLSLTKQDWTDSDQLKASGDLFLSIGHWLVHLKDQADYEDFENFLTECSLPFRNVIEKCVNYNEFKNCLDNVKNFELNNVARFNETKT